MTMPTLISVNVGLPRDIQWRSQTVHTGIWKQPVLGRRVVRRLNLEGDGQGDLVGHGGEHRAVMVYQLESYRHWERFLDRKDLSYGQFGENFTVDGLADDDVCIGDRYRIGTALFEVTQPRVTCYRIGIRMDEPRMASLLVSHKRPGFYFRVLEEGEVGSGDVIEKVADGPETLTIAEADALLYLPGHPREQLDRALKIPALSPGWKQSFEALSSADPATSRTGNPGLANVAGEKAAWQGFRSLRVSRLDRESLDILSFSFEDPNGKSLPPALPGQFIVLKMQPEPAAPPLLRNYSLSGKPGAENYRISVKREAKGAASSFLHNHVSPGDLVSVSAPRGAFTLRPGQRPVVLLSVGVGATPLVSMLYSLANTRTSRDVWWLYGARDGKNHPFAQEVQSLLRMLPRGRSYVTYSRPGIDDRFGQDYDFSGHLDMPVVQGQSVPRDADFYLCGPPLFLKDLTSGLISWGVSPHQVYTETFGPGESLKPGVAITASTPVHAPVGIEGTGPEISFTRSGLTVAWSSKFQSLLELAEACDVPVRWSCRTGVCHTCECGLIGGELKYEPEPLDAPAVGNVLICCAQPTGDVQLDL